MTDPVFTDEDIFKGTEEYPVLGPAYFAARRMAERFMQAFEVEHFEPLVKRFTKDFSDTLWTDISDHLLSDTESNLQSEIWRTVDQCVEGILSGEQWIMNKYALGSKYDCEKIRAAVAQYIPQELQNARIADLESEIKSLKERLSFYQR